jgi:TonB-linked SusC/RagA family outer membrane protein
MIFKIKKHLKKRGKILLLFISLAYISFAQAQERLNVSGVVSDQNGDPLVGVSVLEKGTSNGSVTDMDGKYQIAANQGATLVFSYIGYVSQEKTVTGAVVNVTLVEDTKSLEEVIVIGYGIQKKSSVTGAISTVNVKDMQNRTVSNVQQALQGKIAGVNIVQGSAAPGSTPTVNIRGIGSTTGGAPLYVVDGRIADNGIGGIDPNDIESMEILKDAASAAIYGISAGNGVVIITTKKGKAGVGKISYDFQASVQSIARVPKVMNSEQYIDWMTSANYLKMSQVLQYWDFSQNTDWAKETFENSMMYRHNLSFSGGSQTGNYYLGLSYLGNDGYVKGDNDTYNRATAVINANYNVKSWLEIGTNNQLEYYTRRSVAEGSEYGSLLMATLQLDPLTPVTYSANALPDYMQRALADGHKLYQNENGDYYSMSPYQISDQYNPFVMREKSKNSISKGFNLSGTIFANIKPMKELVITSRFSYWAGAAKGYTFNQHFYANASVNQLYNQLIVSATTPVGYQVENFANYTKSFGEHHLNAMLGMSMRQNFSYGVTGSIQGSGENDLGIKDDPLFAYPSFASTTSTKNVSGGEETRISWLSQFGRITYDYDNRYFMQASLRRDGADLSTLPQKKRWGLFPAVSLGWAVSNEKFFEPLHQTVSFLKLRASWGQNGTSSMLAGSWLWNNSIIGVTFNGITMSPVLYPFGNELNYTNAYFPNVLGNPVLGWERQEQMDMGLDARFLSDRLTLGFDYFNKQSKDLIMNGVTLSNIVGNSASPINAGTMENKGVELELGWNDNAGKDFRYGVKANFATVSNKVTSIHESLSRINGQQVHTNVGVTVFEPGYPAWYIRGYQVEKIDPATGDPIFVDRNPDGILNDDDKTMIGNPMPDFTYGLTLNAAYKGFDLTVFGTGAYGNDILLCVNRGDRLQANTLLKFYNERWTPENPTAPMARNNAANIEKYWLSDAYIFDGSFFKIKQIQLGYTVPSSLLKKVGFELLRLYCSLDDFITFTSYPGFDPETVGTGNAAGLDRGSYPSSKKIVFGLNLTF